MNVHSEIQHPWISPAVDDPLDGQARLWMALWTVCMDVLWMSAGRAVTIVAAAGAARLASPEGLSIAGLIHGC